MSDIKYIFVTGGVTSSLGKGILAASLSKLLQARGYQVNIKKFDPYINVDPGTMNPYEHGECYVTDDGAETDLDLGHYERFLNISLSKNNNITAGKIYHKVITKERQGQYLGKTVQVIPHITDEIKLNYKLHDEKCDIVISEIGGCIGDIESLPFIEAIRQVQWEIGRDNVLVIHLTLVPYLKTSQELKTKPTQHSVKTLLGSGINPDIIVCRSEYTLPSDVKSKIALFCNVPVHKVISAIDTNIIYDIPILMRKERLDEIVLDSLDLNKNTKPYLEKWKAFLGKLKHPIRDIEVAIVGKYTKLPDSYKSINEALIHAGAFNECRIHLSFVSSEDLEHESVEILLQQFQGIIIAPGFGDRGIEGKIKAARYLRENRIPFFGICLGLQCAVIEYARHILKLENAHSTEIDKQTENPVIYLLESQKNITDKGGTMRLGAYNCKLLSNSKVFQIYKNEYITERHRHRYEFNNKYLEIFEKNGFIASGKNPESNLVEIMELTDHPFYVCTQYHPEFKSRVEEPHPLFVAFNQACIDYKYNN